MRELIQILSSCPRKGPKETDDTWQRSTPPIYKPCCHLYGCWQYRSHQKSRDWLLSTAGSPRIRLAFLGFLFFLGGRVSTFSSTPRAPLQATAFNQTGDVLVWTTKKVNKYWKEWKFHYYIIPATWCDGSLGGAALRHRWCVKLCLKVLGNSAPHLITAINSTDGIPYFLHYARGSVNVRRHLCDFQVWGWTEKPAFSLVKYRS